MCSDLSLVSESYLNALNKLETKRYLPSLRVKSVGMHGHDLLSVLRDLTLRECKPLLIVFALLEPVRFADM